MKQLKLVMNRDVSVVTLEAWYRGHVSSWQYFGYPVKDLLFIFDGRAVKSYRWSKPFEKALPKHFVGWLKTTRNRKKLLSAFDRYLKDRQIIKKLPKEEPLTQIKKMYFLTIDGLRGLLPIFWFPIWHEKIPLPQDIVDKAIYIREAQEEFFDNAIDAVDHYLKLLAKKKGLPYGLLRLATINELKKPNLNTLKARKNGFVYLHGQFFPLSKLSELLKKEGYEIIEAKVVTNNVIRGMVAQPGKAKGQAKVVLARNEMAKFNQSDILVASMTTPWYLPLMKKAAAIVTDEGGITSHAAIVSRELGVPCVIATKVATKVLKDGDILEVDANRGFVRKISP